MLAVFEKVNQNTIGALPLLPEQVETFGNVGLMTLETSSPGTPAQVSSYSPKQPGTLKAPGSGLYYKGFTGTIYLPGWAERIQDLQPNFQGEIDDTDLILGLVSESRMWGAPLVGRGYDVGRPEGLLAARADLDGTFPDAS